MYCGYIFRIKGHDVCNSLSQIIQMREKKDNNKAYGTKC